MFYGPTVFKMCDFHSPFLDLIFIKISWIEKDSIFEKGLIFDTWIFFKLILWLWNFEIFIWNLGIKI